eukprot:scaffold1390_cov249-Pinguiococcus_pyrenoidosus.AAC.4
MSDISLASSAAKTPSCSAPSRISLSRTSPPTATKATEESRSTEAMTPSSAAEQTSVASRKRCFAEAPRQLLGDTEL